MKNKDLKNYIFSLIIILLVTIALVFTVNFLQISNLIQIVSISVLITFVITYVFIHQSQIDSLENNKQLKDTLKIRDAILGLSQKAMHIENEQELYDLIISVAVDVIKNADMGSIILVNDDNTLSFKSCYYLDINQLKENVKLTLENSYIYIAGNGNIKNTIIINNIIEFNQKHNPNHLIVTEDIKGLNEIKSTLCSPIIIDDKLHGMISIDSKNLYSFNEDDIKLVHFFTYEVGRLIKLHSTLATNTYLSRYDCLTNTYNRRYFKDAVNDLLTTLDDNESFSLISVDLNNLKLANDNYGHDIGDKFILSFVETVKQNLTDKDIFSRYGGDEFIIILKNTPKTDAKAFVNKTLLSLKENPICINNEFLVPTYSYGIVEYPKDGRDYKELIKLADSLMYENKKSQKI